MLRNELVTCVMVTRDRPHLAQRAIQCFLSQTYIPRELLIVNDGDLSYSDVIPHELPVDVSITELHIETAENNTLGELRNLALDSAHGGLMMSGITPTVSQFRFLRLKRATKQPVHSNGR